MGRADGSRTIFLPDVAWVSDVRLAQLSDDDAEEPPFSPDVAIEIRSPVDPERETIDAHSAGGVITFCAGECFASPAMAWFSFDVAALFAAAERGRRRPS